MKKQNSSIKAQIIRSAFILLSLLAICAIPFALAQRNGVGQSKQSQKAAGAGSSVQQRFGSPAVQDPWGGSPLVRMPSQMALPGPVRFQSFENPAPVPRSLLPSVNTLINNNNGTSGCNEFTQSETSVVSFGSTVVAGFNDSGSYDGGTNQFTGY